jgi:hypothetical protein
MTPAFGAQAGTPKLLSHSVAGTTDFRAQLEFQINIAAGGEVQIRVVGIVRVSIIGQCRLSKRSAGSHQLER